jgi:hypothetical protein
METDEKNVVGKQHEARKLIGNPAFAKGVVSEITFVMSVISFVKDFTIQLLAQLL